MITDVKYNRFKDAIWFQKASETTVMVGGAGGIGSWTTMLLSRAGFRPVVYDFDLLEEHNIGGQLFLKTSVGKTKVEALQKVIDYFCDEDIMVFNERIVQDSLSNPIFISAFDNMQARKVSFENWCKVNTYSNSIFIDGRLTAEQMQIFCVTANNSEKYRKYLFDDSEVPDAPCTFKQTSHAAAMIASHIVGFLTNHISGLPVPFYWEYNIPLDLLNYNPDE